MTERKKPSYTQTGWLKRQHVRMHNGLMGKERMAFSCVRSIYTSPSTTPKAKAKAAEILNAWGDLAALLKERVDP